MRGRWLFASVLIALLAPASCRRRAPVPRSLASAAPAETASAALAETASAAAGPSGPRFAAPALSALFPAVEGDLVLDEHADATSFGAAGEPPLAVACELLAADCERLARLGLRRVVRVAYADRKDSRARALVSLLRFEGVESAFAYYTARIGAAVEAGKPALSAWEVGEGEAVLGETSALGWRADHFIELTFGDERLSPERSAARARTTLPLLVRSICARLPGSAEPPDAARLLPERDRRPLSLRYERFDLFDVQSLGPGARASYADRAGMYELSVLVRTDADAAEDVLETLRRMPAARVLKNGPYRATRVVEADEKTGRRVAWMFGQRGNVVAGAGMELDPQPKPKREVLELDPRLARMKKLLDGIRP